MLIRYSSDSLVILLNVQTGKTVLFMSGTSKIKNENPDSFEVYLAKRKAAAEGREWVPEGAAPAAAAPAAAAPAAASSAAYDAKAGVKEVANSKIKNANPDDFATYLAKRQAAAEGRVWTPGS
jgi:hypothetical protein